ncbi:alpha/beta fold hydrolase [Kocuria tytonis]|uniref:Alpha/beta fold hydrolase n=1 Tax=Kocuria tytonis TaxID=2054280 RepID=A0A495A9T7_9MICC|nr:alpha/beta fold hydrolase [Kocuria tytonis]RKQ36809.1 alpha/beta fold hydrolase [Kocuria tytonis]
MPQDAKPTLKTTLIGSGDHRLVFLHGLFGRGKNFTNIAKGLQPQFRCLLVDLPNHGDSAWTESFGYADMADTVAAELRAGFAADGPVDVLGHSMGGKVAMILALRHPDLVRRLVVEDIAPVDSKEADTASSRGDFEHLLGSLKRLDLSGITHRSQADAALRAEIPQDMVRGFLLQNLRHRDGGFGWQPNLDLLHAELDAVGDWPAQDVAGRTFTGPVLWIAGEDSPYIQDADAPAMRALFPKTVRITVRGASHWVHSDRPEQVIMALRTFLLAER